MALRIEAYSSRHSAGVARLNARLDEARIDPGLRLPVDGPDEAIEFDVGPADELARRQYLVIDDDVVRGGFILQEQRFEVAGHVRWVANIQTPISEGVVDRRFALVAPRMMNLILMSKPLVFAVGMGGRLDQPFARLVATMKWPVGRVPFAFYVVHPGRFLNQIRIGSRFASRALTRVAAWSGLGWVGLRCLSTASAASRQLGRRRPGRVGVHCISEWGTWTDALWAAYRHGCAFGAVRDCQTLPLLHPLSQQRLRAYRCVDAKDRDVGWIAMLWRDMRNNPYFGNLRVASVLDAVGVPGWEESIMNTVTRLASESAADVIVSNQHHRAWRRAQWRAGFLEGPSNYLLALSPRLAAMLNPLERSYERVHITRADGDGRTSL